MSDYLANLIQKGFYITTDGEQRPLFPTSTSPQSLRLIIKICEDIGAKNTLELGTGFGLGSIAIMSADSMQSPDSSHFTVDFSTEHDQIVAALNHIKLAKPICDFKFIHKDTCTAMKELIEQKKEFDFIFIDAKHTFEAVINDFHFANQLLKPEGIIVFDDTYLPEIRAAINFILGQNTNYNSFKIEAFQKNFKPKIIRVLRRFFSKQGKDNFKYSCNGLNIYAIQKD